MFAPRIAKPQSKAATTSNSELAPPSPHRLKGRLDLSAAEAVRLLQRTIGNQATMRLFEQRARNMAGREPGGRGLAPGLSWDLSEIPVFPPGDATHEQQPFPLTASPLQGVIQPKLEIGAVDDPLEHEADRVAEQVMRMPEPVEPAPPAVTRAFPQMHRKCSCGGSCEKCRAETLDGEHQRVQRKPDTPGPTQQPTPSTGGGATKTMTNCASDYLVESWG